MLLVVRPPQYLPPLSLLRSLLLSLSLSRLRSRPPLRRSGLRRLFLSMSSSSCRVTRSHHVSRHLVTHLEVHLVAGPVVPPALPAVQLTPQLPADRLEVHEVAEPGPRALPGLVLPAARLSEVSHGRQLGVYRPTSEPAVVEVAARLLGILK